MYLAWIDNHGTVVVIIQRKTEGVECFSPCVVQPSFCLSLQPAGCHVPDAPSAVCHGQRWTTLWALVQSDRQRQPCSGYHSIWCGGRYRCCSRSYALDTCNAACGLEVTSCFLLVISSHHGYAVWPGSTGGFDVYWHPVCLHTCGPVHLNTEVIHLSSFFSSVPLPLTHQLDCCYTFFICIWWSRYQEGPTEDSDLKVIESKSKFGFLNPPSSPNSTTSLTVTILTVFNGA